MEFRPYYFAREWIKMGYHVDIVAADYSHLRIKNPKIEKDFETEEIDGIRYHWVKAGRYEGNGIKRALSMFRFTGKLWGKARQIARTWKPDVVITSSTYPLDTYAGQRIAKKCKARLIHEVHDMWPITPIEMGGMSKYHPFIMLLQLAENSFCRHSDYVVSLLPKAKRYLMMHGMEEAKFISIPNGVVLEEWENPQALPESTRLALEDMRKKHGFVLCFFGSHTKSYALEYVIDAVKTYDSTRIGLVFVGNGTEKDNLKRRSEGCSNIKFLDPVPKKCIPALMDQVDGIYIGAVDNRIARFGLCMNKLFDSMMGGKPILFAVHTPTNYIKKYQCGISVEAENVQALIDGIGLLLSKTETERRTMGENGKRAVLENFNYAVLAKRFEKVFKM